MLEHVTFLLTAYIAAIFATIAGFGSSTLLIPVAILYFDFQTAVFLVACFHLCNNLFKVKLFFSHIDLKIVVKFGIPSILFAFIGAWMMVDLDPELLKKALAVFLIVYAIYSIWNPDVKILANTSNAILGGLSSGLLAGLIGLGGAIRAMFLVSFGLPKESYIATSALIALAVDLTRIPTYLVRGTIDRNYFFLLPFLICLAYFGVKTGQILLHRINESLFRKIVLLALLGIGIKLILQG